MMRWERFKKGVRGARPELALLCGLLLALCVCLAPVRAQEGLADKLTRLHVVANSDSAADQSLKLGVRDRILREAGYQYGCFEDRVDDALLRRLQRAAQAEVSARGYGYPVTVTREKMFFDTRRYDGFSLPAGYYDAVRVVIGEGKGKNWWCVLFPPLCLGAAGQDITQAARGAGLTEDEIALIREDGTGYVVRFKLMEAWGSLRHWLDR